MNGLLDTFFGPLGEEYCTLFLIMTIFTLLGVFAVGAPIVIDTDKVNSVMHKTQFSCLKSSAYRNINSYPLKYHKKR